MFFARYVKPWPVPTLPKQVEVVWFSAALAAGLLCYFSAIDRWVTDALTPNSHPTFWWAMTQLGEGWLQFIICALVGAVLWGRKNRADARIWFYAGPISLLVGALNQLLLKIPFGRPRPKLWPEFYDFRWFEVAGALRGFPSGHALTSFVIVGFFWARYAGWRWFLLALALLAAASRVFLGAHYVGDVLAGAGIGFAFGQYAWRWVKQK